MAKPHQRGLPLPVPREGMERQDFVTGPGNEVALALLDSWPGGWPAHKLILSGPAGAGKTHLSRIWAKTSGAVIVEASLLPEADIPALAVTNIVVEDVPLIAGKARAEEALFHLHNILLSDGRSLLMTGREAAARWRIRLPDLASRIQGTPAVSIAAPDDAMLGALLIKFFSDRQIMPTPDVIPYLLPRIERSFLAARTVAAALDAQSLAEKKPVTRVMAARVLDRLEGGTKAH